MEINEIIDNNFMDKDVSELVVGDYYLFHIEEYEDGCKVFFYKDGVIFTSQYSDGVDSVSESVAYRTGTLSEWVERYSD